MEKTAINFLWKAPVERLFIGALLFTVYTQNKTIKEDKQSYMQLETAYQSQLIECARKTDSMRVYYNGLMDTELRERIKRYDKLIEELKKRKS